MSKHAWKLGLGLFLLLIGRLAFFSEPYGISVDESTYMAIAERAAAEGPLYNVAVDRKPPLLFWTYQLIQSVFGPWNIHAIHFIAILWTLLVALLCERLIRKPEVFYFVCLFSACFPRGIFAFNAELLMMLPVLLSLILLREAYEAKRDSTLYLYISGSVFLAGLACFYKQYAGLIYAPAYLYLSLRDWRCYRRQVVLAGLSSVSLVLALASISLVFYFRGAWDEYLYWVWLDSFSYMDQDASQLNEERSVWVVLLGLVGAWLPLFALCLLRLPELLRKHQWLLILVAASASTAFLSGRYYTHYFIPFLIMLSGLAAVAYESWAKTRTRWAKLGMLSFVCFPFIFFSVFNLFQDQFNPGTSFDVPVQSRLKSLSVEIQSLSLPSDRIQVWGMASQIYVMSQRGAGTSFIFADFVSGRLPGFKSEVSIPTPGAKERFLAELRSSPPKLIIDTSGPSINDYQYFPISRFPEIQRSIEQKYSVTEFEGFDIWMYSDQKQ